MANNSNINPHDASTDTYDLHIVPAETAARKAREGENYKQVPEELNEDSESINTTDGYTVDGEGLINNYATEPEMYYEVPGDMQEQKDSDEAAKRAAMLEEQNQTDEAIT
jgi:hypothetical protein